MGGSYDPQYQAAYRYANREKIAVYQKEYRERNADKLAAYRTEKRVEHASKQRARRDANRTKIAEYQREYRRRTRSERREYDAEWRATHPAVVKEYRVRHAERARERNAVRRARRLGVRLVSTPLERGYALLLRGDPCAYCGSPAAELDHVVPLAAGGEDGPTNLVGACRSCNAKKHARPLLLFLLEG